MKLSKWDYVYCDKEVWQKFLLVFSHSVTSVIYGDTYQHTDFELVMEAYN